MVSSPPDSWNIPMWVWGAWKKFRVPKTRAPPSSIQGSSPLGGKPQFLGNWEFWGQPSRNIYWWGDSCRAGKGDPAQGFCQARRSCSGTIPWGITQIHGSSVNFKLHPFASEWGFQKYPEDPGQLQSSSGVFFPPPSLLLGGSAPSPGIFSMWKLKSSTGFHPFPCNIWAGRSALLFRGWIGVFPSRKNQGKSPGNQKSSTGRVLGELGWHQQHPGVIGSSGLLGCAGGKVEKANILSKIGLGWNCEGFGTERVALTYRFFNIYIYFLIYICIPCIVYTIYINTIFYIYIIF